MKRLIFITIFLIGSISHSSALIKVDITRGNLDPLPIAVSPLHVDDKSQKLEDYNINSILCVGEDESILNKGEREKFLLNQLDSYFQDGLCPKFIAYEPVWAIGTGIPADKKNIDDALKIISFFLKEKKLKKIPLLYGGSVSSKNVEEIMSSNILSGCLVGNASLDGEEFARIAEKL